MELGVTGGDSVAGGKQGGFRIGSEQGLMDDSGPSAITVGDLAVPIVDEIETSKHLRERFTLAS